LSDGVGYSWIDGIRDYANKLISDEEFQEREKRFPLMTPTTKEMYWFRTCFEKFFPSKS